jgi:hypothetical protein
LKAGKDNSWNKFMNGEDLKIFYRKEEGKGIYTFYLEKMAEAPLFNVLSVISELQTYKDWVPLMYKSEFTDGPTLLRKLSTCGITVPWPFKNREWFVKVSGTPINEGEQGAIILSLKSFKGDKYMGVDI